MRFLSLLFLLFVSDAFMAEQVEIIHYEASYLGVPLLDMTMTQVVDDTSISISYDNQLKAYIAYFHPIHNIYKVQYDRVTYEPLRWSKKVSEGRMKFYLAAERSLKDGLVAYSNRLSRQFPQGAFTVFSATHYLASQARYPDHFPMVLSVFIDGELWRALVSRYTQAEPHLDFEIEPGQILIQADLSYQSGDRVMAENDILMDVIATEGTRFMLWVEEDGVFSKAQFGSFPKAVVLERTDP